MIFKLLKGDYVLSVEIRAGENDLQGQLVSLRTCVWEIQPKPSVHTEQKKFNEL